MIMKNQTRELQLFPFFIQSNFLWVYEAVFFMLYLFGVFINSVIIMVIYTSSNLHTPMYLFLSNLALVDICYTTTIVPNLLHLCISKNATISYSACFTQMYFYYLVASTEDLLTVIMAFDRYVAICNPLLYHSILNRRHCFSLMTGCWLVGWLNSNILITSASKVIFCHSKIIIPQLYCDGKTVMGIACAGLQQFYYLIYSEMFVLGFIPFICCLISYKMIIQVILKIKSKEGRKKTFSTCSSHLTVIIMYYTTGTFAYMLPNNSVAFQQTCSAFYAIVTPMLNPLVYCLRNNDVKMALKSKVDFKGKQR